MTETTQTHPTHPDDPADSYEAYRPRSPEFRAAVDALRGMRQDLFHDAFAYRPLPRKEPTGRLARSLKGRKREYAAWSRHALVCAGGALAMLIAWADDGGGLLGLVIGLLVLAPVLMTLVRPVGAFWLSLASTLAVSLVGTTYSNWPWLPASFISHLVVLAVVAIRTRPRTAAWMWLLTGAYGFVAETVFGWGHYDTNIAPMLVFSAIVLLTGTVWHIRRRGRAGGDRPADGHGA